MLVAVGRIPYCISKALARDQVAGWLPLTQNIFVGFAAAPSLQRANIPPPLPSRPDDGAKGMECHLWLGCCAVCSRKSCGVRAEEP